MFVPYDGQTRRFDVAVTEQRRFSAQKANRIKRERTVKLKQRLELEKKSQRARGQEQWPTTPPDSACSPMSTDDEPQPVVIKPQSPVLELVQQASPPPSDQNEGSDEDEGDDLFPPVFDDALARTVSSKLGSLSSMDMIFGGSRTDPFRSYPIKWREYFPAVLDYCREVVAPNEGYFNFLIQHDVLFEAIATYILCVMPAKTPQTKLAMMYHYGCTLHKIGGLLSSETERASDAVILAISNLAVICAYCGDEKRFDTHLRGIYRLIEMRGGRDAVIREENSWVATALTAVEALATMHSQKTIADATEVSEDESALLECDSVPPPNPRLNSKEPTYPKHPFPPELCVTVSKLPEGLQDIALSGVLSVQLLSRLSITRSQVVHLMATATNDDRDRDWQALLVASTPVERMSWLAVLVYHLRSSTYTADCQALSKTILECCQSRLGSKAEADCCLWGSCMLLATPDPDRALARERETVFASMMRSNPGMNYDRMERVAHKFFWSESLSASLRGYLRQRRV